MPGEPRAGHLEALDGSTASRTCRMRSPSPSAAYGSAFVQLTCGAKPATSDSMQRNTVESGRVGNAVERSSVVAQPASSPRACPARPYDSRTTCRAGPASSASHAHLAVECVIALAVTSGVPGVGDEHARSARGGGEALVGEDERGELDARRGRPVEVAERRESSAARPSKLERRGGGRGDDHSVGEEAPRRRPGARPSARRTRRRRLAIALGRSVAPRRLSASASASAAASASTKGRTLDDARPCADLAAARDDVGGERGRAAATCRRGCRSTAPPALALHAQLADGARQRAEPGQRRVEAGRDHIDVEVVRLRRVHAGRHRRDEPFEHLGAHPLAHERAEAALLADLQHGHDAIEVGAPRSAPADRAHHIGGERRARDAQQSRLRAGARSAIRTAPRRRPGSAATTSAAEPELVDQRRARVRLGWRSSRRRRRR